MNTITINDTRKSEREEKQKNTSFRCDDDVWCCCGCVIRGWFVQSQGVIKPTTATHHTSKIPPLCVHADTPAGLCTHSIGM